MPGKADHSKASKPADKRADKAEKAEKTQKTEKKDNVDTKGVRTSEATAAPPPAVPPRPMGTMPAPRVRPIPSSTPDYPRLPELDRGSLSRWGLVAVGGLLLGTAACKPMPSK